MDRTILTVGSTKGGVGKTSLSLQIAIGRALEGRDVWLINADQQATSTTALAIRGEAERQPSIATAHYPTATTLRTQLKHQRARFQDIVIDVGGRDSGAFRVAMAELWGLFVEDATLTIGTLACIALAMFVVPRIGIAAQWRGPLLFGAIVLMLLENVFRGARKP